MRLRTILCTPLAVLPLVACAHLRSPRAAIARASPQNPIPFSPGFDVEKVLAWAISLPSHSWEWGTASEMLLELYNPELSVFGKKPFPIPRDLDPSQIQGLTYAASKIVIGTGVNGLANGDGAVGDPASLGVPAVMLGKSNATYATAAASEVEYMMNEAPRWPNGAISHRADVAELWADFVYMAPPTLAYYAADTDNATLLQQTVDQCGFYREVLQYLSAEPYSGVWRHIIGPQSQDLGLWSTGNAWAAGGMARVLATVMKAPVARRQPWKPQAISNLTQWIKEILDGAMGAPMDDELLRNYLDNVSGDGHGYGEISGTSLLAAVAYRMAVMDPTQFGPGHGYIQWADDIRAVLGGVDAAGNPHVTEDGIVTPAVNPLNWYDTTPWTTGSPEGQNFVVLMYAAWRDCVYAGICGQ